MQTSRVLCFFAVCFLAASVLPASTAIPNGGVASSTGRGLRADAAAAARRPRIYVYQLPANYTTTNYADDPNGKGQWGGLYGLESLFPHLLLSSPYVTTNPDEADFFYMHSFLYHGAGRIPDENMAAATLRVRERAWRCAVARTAASLDRSLSKTRRICGGHRSY